MTKFEKWSYFLLSEYERELLSKNYLSDKGCKVLLDMLKENASVEILALDYNGVNDQGLLLEIMKAAEQILEMEVVMLIVTTAPVAVCAKHA